MKTFNALLANRLTIDKITLQPRYYENSYS